MSTSMLLRATALVSAGAILCGPAVGQDGPAAQALRAPVAIGQPVPPFTAKEFTGGTFDLATARAVTPERAFVAVAAAAKALGAGEVKPETELASLPPLRQGDALDAARVAALADAAGRAYGMHADAASVAGWTKVSDVADWVARAASAPIVFVAWSSSCPTCKMYEERFGATVAATGARVYLLASNYNDPDDAVKAAVEERKIPYPILLDRDQAVADVLGARRTPHVFVVDAKGVLRYAGAIDSDPALTQPEAERVPWLRQALAAITAGRSFDVLQTTPKG